MIFEDMYKELESRPTPWFMRYNTFSVYREKGGDLAMVSFLGNWIHVFYKGLGLDPELKYYMGLRYGNKDHMLWETGKPESDGVKKDIEKHFDDMLSARSLCLFTNTYPLSLGGMKKKSVLGFYDNYGIWHEPDFTTKLKYGPNVSLFHLFDNTYIRSMLESRNIITIGKLCEWIDENAELIAARKAGIGKVTASILLDNSYIRHWCKEGLPVLQKIAGR